MKIKRWLISHSLPFVVYISAGKGHAVFFLLQATYYIGLRKVFNWPRSRRAIKTAQYNCRERDTLVHFYCCSILWWGEHFSHFNGMCANLRLPYLFSIRLRALFVYGIFFYMCQYDNAGEMAKSEYTAIIALIKLSNPVKLQRKRDATHTHTQEMAMFICCPIYWIVCLRKRIVDTLRVHIYEGFI